LTNKKTAHFMVAAYKQQHFIYVETPSAYVPPQPRSHANRVGLYSDELVAAPNPRVGEEARVVAVLDAAAERQLSMDAVEEAMASSGPAVDLVAEGMCASLPPACCQGAALTDCTQSSRKQTDDEVDNGCTGHPLAAE
jgi:hypothetical protein